MTREEAIRLIQAHMIAHNIGVYPHIRLAEALDMAIAALRAQQGKNICGCTNLECASCTPGPCEHRKQPNAPLTGWISVKDRLPDRTMPPHDVLVYHDLNCGMFIDRAWYSHDKNKWRSAVGMNLKVTHWMPLPEAPQKEA